MHIHVYLGILCLLITQVPVIIVSTYFRYTHKTLHTCAMCVREPLHACVYTSQVHSQDVTSMCALVSHSFMRYYMHVITYVITC